MPLASRYLTGIKGKALMSSALIFVYLRAIIHTFFSAAINLLTCSLHRLVFLGAGGRRVTVAWMSPQPREMCERRMMCHLNVFFSHSSLLVSTHLHFYHAHAFQSISQNIILGLFLCVFDSLCMTAFY